MLRLLEEFDAIFDFEYRVGDIAIGDLIESALGSLERRPLQEWGATGPRDVVGAETGRFVSFYYRPHLFPGMDFKLRLAHELQFYLLPRELPSEAPVSIASVLESYCHLSGDLFGWEMLRDDRFLVWIVDMAGHGVRAGLTSAVLKLLVNRLRERSCVERVAGELNRALHGSLKQEHRTVFATAFFMCIDRQGGAVYSSAGHPPMLLRRRSGDIERLESLDLPIGMFGETQYGSREVRIERGETLLLYTDGLLEAQGEDGEMFGLSRVRSLLAERRDTPEQVTGAIYREVVDRHDLDKLDDDITFLALMLR